MDATPKTDLFIERFARAVNRLRYFKGLKWSNHDYITQFMRAQEEDVLFLQWHLSGVYKTLPSLDEVNYRGRFPDVLKYVLSQPIISYKDMGVELWELSPNIDELGKYMYIFKAKLDKAVTWLPQRYSLSDVIFDNTPYTDIVRKVQADGLLSKIDAEYILVNVYRAISCIHLIQDSIKQMFDEYLETVRETPQESKPIHFSVSKSYEDIQRILTALQQQEFVSTKTTIDTFYYRMTGNGAPTQERIIWVKKSSNRAINLTSLIDFVVAMGVKLDEALSQINRIFCRFDNSDINLSDDTKTKSRQRNRLCQSLSIYHEKIMNIIQE